MRLRGKNYLKHPIIRNIRKAKYNIFGADTL